ncbi:MAG: hypothetical protein AAGI27_15355 [Pseudomonadota bacterium]
MNKEETRTILRYFKEYRERFYYFKDRYALLLLNLAADGEISKNDIKASPFAQLLDKTVVKELMSTLGSKAVAPTDLEMYWPKDVQFYYLTLGVWNGTRDRWNQTSRRGYNLVLQLNFSNQHNGLYRRLVDPECERPFEYRCHPVSKTMHTLAWSRMDIDLERGEALIEEIQTDWIREARWAYREALSDNPWFYWNTDLKKERVIRYVEKVLKAHEATWDEAMLASTLWFLRREIGIRKIYYHTHETGAAMKAIRNRLPPKSLYTRLPKKFCFKETREAPAFIWRKSRSLEKRKKVDEAKFHALTF